MWLEAWPAAGRDALSRKVVLPGGTRFRVYPRGWAASRDGISGFPERLGCQAGSGHGQICNSLIIRYHFNSSVETRPIFGYVSTLCFVTN